MTIASLRTRGGRALFSAAGVEVAPWFARSGVKIPWDQVLCVSPIPSLRRSDERWITLQGSTVAPKTLREGLRFYSLQLGLADRSEVLSRAPLPVRAWLLVGGAAFKPIYTGDTGEEKPHPTYGYLELSLPKRWVRENGPSLLAALDIVESHSRFQLICV